MGVNEPPAAALNGATTGAFDQPGGQNEGKGKQKPEAVERTQDEIADARERAWHNYGAAAHYLRLVQGHLELGDDAGAIWSRKMVSDYLQAAERDYEPARKSFHERITTIEPAA